jgi:hypothetical protein
MLSVLFGALLCLTSVATVLADQPVSSSPTGATVLGWPGDDANHEPYWEAFFGPGYGCTKVDEIGAFTTTEAHGAIVAKGGQFNFIWQPGPAATYSTNPEVSHWFYCDGPAQEVIDPSGSIGGPCADPAYYGVFDNTASTVTLRFRFRWYTSIGLHTVWKDVPAGAVYRTWEHWSKPNTLVRVGYQNPDTKLWVNLATQLTVKGRYPQCEYKRGWDYPTTS